MQRQVRILLALCTLTVLSCVSTRVARKPANAEVPVSIKVLTRETFMNIATKEGIEDVAGLIKVLAERYPDHLQFRTAMYASGSLQEATFIEPRIIVFGPLADFIFTFNGSKDMGGGGTVEMMSYDHDRKDFSFTELGFKKELKEGKLRFLLDDEVELENEKVIVTKPNTTKCMDCHGYVKPGPIWGNHFFWLGAFGSNDDLLFGSFRPGRQDDHGRYGFLNDLKWPRSQGRALDLPNGAPDVELNGYISFLKSSPTHPRYKYLPPQAFEAGFRKYIAGTPVTGINEVEAIAKEGVRLGMGEPDRPNGYLGDKLMRWSMDSLAAAISKKPSLLAKVKEILSKPMIDYPFTWGPGRRQFFEQDLAGLYEKFTWLKPLEDKRGAFKFHLNKAIQEEFELQTEKTERHEQLLKTKLVVNPGWTMQLNQDPTPAIGAYGRLLGHSLTRTEILAMEWEAGSLPDLALLDFLLYDSAIDLNSYDLNQMKSGARNLSLHSSGLDYLREILGNELTQDSPKSTY